MQMGRIPIAFESNMYVSLSTNSRRPCQHFHRFQRRIAAVVVELGGGGAVGIVDQG